MHIQLGQEGSTKHIIFVLSSYERFSRLSRRPLTFAGRQKLAVNCPPTFDKKLVELVFVQRSVSTLSCRSAMTLCLPKPDIRDVLQTIPCRHAIQISKCQHINRKRRKRTIELANQLVLLTRSYYWVQS